MDPGYGMEKFRIRDKHPGSATLLYSDFWFQVPFLMALGENQSVKATRTKFISFADVSEIWYIKMQLLVNV